jgi:Ni,Fe-hydrogenase III large subunit/NADH:ubiquinone oxidoreductase subunit C
MTTTDVIDIDEPVDLAMHSGHLLAVGYQLALVAAHHDGPTHPTGGIIRVVYVFIAGPPDRRVEVHLRTDATDPRLPSLAALSFPASRFEREVHDMYGVAFEGHPMARPLVHHPRWPADWHPMRHDASLRPALRQPQPFPFVTVEGDGVYEIPVGPVHAGLIEPGHFRFSVVGETILRLKARLWYVHKGIEKLAEGRTVSQAMPLAERISGDTATGHALAYSLAVEDALDLTVTPDIARARAVLLELERLHNHIADIGALCNDVAYGIVAAHTSRIRERLLRLNHATTGHRLLRGAIFPGGVALRHVPDPTEIATIAADVADIVDIALSHSVIRDRFTGTAVLTRQQAMDIGTVGYVAKASGLNYDARVAHPHYIHDGVTVPVRDEGDVLARFQIRAEETQVSATMLADLLPTLPAVRMTTDLPAPGRHRSGIGIAEGWRGTIVQRIELDATGAVSRWKIVDPSFLNWPALPVAMSDTIVPDFPLANKSFNLSYAGNDL